MSSWLTAWRNRDSDTPGDSIMELMVLAGEDAGQQFTLEGDRVLVGRGQPESGRIDVVRLQDKSVSRRQAWIHRTATGASIEHIASASNRTLLNGVEVESAPLAVGDRIEMGRVVIDVRERPGMNLRGLTEIMEDAARESTLTGSQAGDPSRSRETTEPAIAITDEVTDVRPMQIKVGELTLVRGVDCVAGSRFPIFAGTTRIGRGGDVEIQIPELGVSRLHAELVVDGRSIRLVSRSRTNPTLINGFPVHESVEVGHGDEIQLADRVALGITLSAARLRGTRQPGDSESGLSGRMERKIDLDREIEEFNVMGSFLDVDVVASREMKQHGQKAEHIIVSFERFRAYVGGICEERAGQVLNSNGDELMCFFETAEAAVRAGLEMLSELPRFNREQNLLSLDFRFRLGAHTGVSLVDLETGIAYSDVLDTAGHIQKLAEPNTLLISQATLDSLSEGFSATPVAEMTGDAGPIYRIG